MLHYRLVESLNRGTDVHLHLRVWDEHGVVEILAVPLGRPSGDMNGLSKAICILCCEFVRLNVIEQHINYSPNARESLSSSGLLEGMTELLETNCGTSASVLGTCLLTTGLQCLVLRGEPED